MNRVRAALRDGWSALTLRARAVLAAGAALLLAGLVLGVVDLVRVGVFAVAVPVVAVVVVRRARLRVSCSRFADPPLVTAGGAVEIGLTITNRSPVPVGTLQLEDALPRHLDGQARFSLAGLGGNRSRTVVYRLSDLRRGRYVAGPLRIAIDDAFGLVDVVRSFSGRSEVLVTPEIEPLSAPGPAVAWDVGDNAGSRSVGSLGAEDASIREYRYGDDLRKIHWRSTARTGTPMVRQDERPWQGRVTVLLDVRRAAHATAPSDAPPVTVPPVTDLPVTVPPAADRPAGPAPVDVRAADSWEWAVSAAASIATRMIASGRDTGLLLDDAGRGLAPVRRPVRTSHEVAAALADVGTVSRTDLDGPAAAATAAARESVVVAVVGALDGSALERLLTLARATGRAAGSLIVVVVDPETWRHPDRSHPTPPAAARLRAAGWAVVVARRGDRVADVWDRLLGAGAAPGSATGDGGPAVARTAAVDAGLRAAAGGGAVAT